jgi:drug/metabolite transporter (DMT)-like permease
MSHAGEFAALATAVCWATGSNLFAAAGQRLGSVVLNRLRLTVAVVFLGTALWITHGSPWPTWATPAQVGILALSGLVGFVWGDANYFKALVILGPSRAALIASLAPLFTAVLAWPVLREAPGPLALLGMALTLGGIFWVLYDRERQEHAHVEGSAAAGVVAGVFAAVGQAAGYVLSKLALRGGIDALSATVVRVGTAVVAVWVIAALAGQAAHTLAALRDRRASAFMAGGAFFGPFLGVTLSLLALQYIEAGVAASITAIYPVLTLLIASRFHGERLTWRALVGTLVAVAGVIVLFLR